MWVTSVVSRVTREFVDVGKGKRLDVFKHRVAQVAGKARARPRAQLIGAHAAEHCQQGHRRHQQPDAQHMPHVAHGDAAVDDRGGQIGNIDLQHHARDREQRRAQRLASVWTDVCEEPFAGLQGFVHFWVHRRPPSSVFCSSSSAHSGGGGSISCARFISRTKCAASSSPRLRRNPVI